MTHHGRWGGRGLELFLTLALLAVTVCLIVAGGAFGFWVGAGLGSSLGGNLMLIGAAGGGTIAGLLWKKLLKYYKYDKNLRPIERNEDERADH